MLLLQYPMDYIKIKYDIVNKKLRENCLLEPKFNTFGYTECQLFLYDKIFAHNMGATSTKLNFSKGVGKSYMRFLHFRA